MIDPAAAQNIKAPEASLAGNAKAQRGETKAGNGFHDALSNAGQSGRHRQNRDDAAADLTLVSDAPSGSEVQAGDTKAAKTPRPLIDLARATHAHPRAGDAAGGSVAGQVAGEKPADAIATRTAKTLARQVLTAGNAPAVETLDAGQLAQVVKHAQVAKTEKADRADKSGDADRTAKAENAATPAGTISELGDVLTMLSNNAASAGQAASAGPRGDRTMAGRLAAGDQAAVAVSAVDARASRIEASAGVPSVEASEPGTPNADADRSFRFVRADAKGQALSMRVGQSDGETVKYDVGSAKEGGQTVAVLDARRYIAPASTNAGAITSAMMGDGEWASAMLPGSELANAASQSSSGKVVNTLKLQMSPIELGNVTATLRLSGDELSVQITVETHAAYKQLSDDQSDMLKALRAHGFAVDQIQVSMATGAAERADSSQANAQGQSSGQQAQRDAQGGDGSGDRRTATMQTDSANGTGKTADDTSAVQAATGGAGATRPDHVYI